MSWSLKSQYIEIEASTFMLKLTHDEDKSSVFPSSWWRWSRKKGGWGCTSVIVLQLAQVLQAQVLQVVQALVLGAGRGLRQPVRKDWFLPSTHMHPPLPICPTLSLTKRHCHICSICFYATSTSCIRYNLSVGLKKRNEPEMNNLNSLALQDCMNW